jgi:hypothetical protein
MNWRREPERNSALRQTNEHYFGDYTPQSVEDLLRSAGWVGLAVTVIVVILFAVEALLT